MNAEANARIFVPLFQSLGFVGLPTQGGASRLTPLALPWADMFGPFRAKN